VKKANNTTYDYDYQCDRPHSTNAGAAISKSVSFGDLRPREYSHVRAFGRGLEGGIAGSRAKFVVQSNEKNGTIGETLLPEKLF
jgi:hypothetical protein